MGQGVGKEGRLKWDKGKVETAWLKWDMEYDLRNQEGMVEMGHGFGQDETMEQVIGHDRVVERDKWFVRTVH